MENKHIECFCVPSTSGFSHIEYNKLTEKWYFVTFTGIKIPVKYDNGTYVGKLYFLV